MVRHAHHKRNQQLTVHPELVEGFVQSILKSCSPWHWNKENHASPVRLSSLSKTKKRYSLIRVGTLRFAHRTLRW
jgi:hypothetical protein